MRIQDVLYHMTVGTTIQVFLDGKEMYLGSFKTDQELSKIEELSRGSVVSSIKFIDEKFAIIYLVSNIPGVCLGEVLKAFEGQEVAVYRKGILQFRGYIGSPALFGNPMVEEIRQVSGITEIHCCF